MYRKALLLKYIMSVIIKLSELSQLTQNSKSESDKPKLGLRLTSVKVLHFIWLVKLYFADSGHCLDAVIQKQSIVL